MSDPRAQRSAVILAGGRGARLGDGPPKAVRELAGRTLLERAYEKAAAFADEVWVSAPPALELPAGPWQVVGDPPGFGPWAGPLVGLASALGAVTRPWALALAVDLPFARPEVFELLWSLRERPATPAPESPAHAEPLGVVPWRLFGPEPLLALYRAEAAPALLAATHSGERAVTRAVSALPLVRVGEDELRTADPELVSFTNLNTPEDWERATAMLGR